MVKNFDMISIGEAVVEVFRKTLDVGLDEPADFVGPFPSGAPAIAADTMAKLGCRSALIATVGADEFGSCITKRLIRDGVDVSNIFELKKTMTGIAFTANYSNGDRKFIFNFSTAATAYLTPDLIDPIVIQSSKWLHISGNVLAFSESTRQAVIKAVEIASENGIGISLDPNIRLEIMEKGKIKELLQPILDKADILFPSSGELSQIFEGESDQEIIASLLKRQIRTIVRKEGSHGCTVFTASEEKHYATFEDVDVVDTTGCGDSFCAGFIYGLLHGWDINRTAVFANAVASITATKKGAMEGIINKEEVMEFLKNRNIDLNGVM